METGGILLNRKWFTLMKYSKNIPKMTKQKQRPKEKIIIKVQQKQLRIQKILAKLFGNSSSKLAKQLTGINNFTDVLWFADGFTKKVITSRKTYGLPLFNCASMSGYTHASALSKTKQESRNRFLKVEDLYSPVANIKQGCISCFWTPLWW